MHSNVAEHLSVRHMHACSDLPPAYETRRTYVHMYIALRFASRRSFELCPRPQKHSDSVHVMVSVSTLESEAMELVHCLAGDLGIHLRKLLVPH